MSSWIRTWMFISAALLLLASKLLYAEGIPTEISEGCLKATSTAIELELKGYEERLKAAEGGAGPEGNAEKFRSRIVELKSEMEKFSAMKVNEYTLSGRNPEDVTDIDKAVKFGPLIPPMKKEISVTVSSSYSAGSVLELDAMTRSGPFYHIAGIKGDDYDVLGTGKRYNLEIFLVYKREYFGYIPNYYVYVAGIKELVP